MCIYIQRFFALGKGLDRQCCTVLDENCCRPGVVEESQQQGPGLERPKTAQKPAQPNEPSLWVRVWLGHFLGYFWFSNPDPKVYRISEPETNTKSETNFEQDCRQLCAKLAMMSLRMLDRIEKQLQGGASFLVSLTSLDPLY